MSDRLLRFGVIGIGGYGAKYISELLALDDANEARLSAVVVRNPAKYPEKSEMLRKRGISFFESLDAMLTSTAGKLDVVAIPTGIDSHEPLTTRALEAGRHVLCEKPAAGTVQEIDRMIAARGRAGKTVSIGFQTVYHPMVQALRERIESGEFERFARGTVLNFAPRPRAYFERNPWVGKARTEGKWVLDCAYGNAMAHYTHLALYLLGMGKPAEHTVDTVCAELYRARPIQTFDTFSIRTRLSQGGTILSLGTHSCRRSGQLIRLVFEKGVVQYDQGQFEIQSDGKTESMDLRELNASAEMFRNVIACVNGESPSRCSLEEARPLTQAVNAAFESCPEMIPVPEAELTSTIPEGKEGDELAAIISINGIEEIFDRCFEEGKTVSECGIPWGKAGTEFSVGGYGFFPSDSDKFSNTAF